MKLIVGLGNPEERYENSRHNVGFMAIDHLAKELTRGPEVVFTFDKRIKALVCTCNVKNDPLILVKPQTYMNNSGWSVELLRNTHKIDTDDIWVIHDDIDLPLGKMRIRKGGGTGGHRGVESIIEHLGTDAFIRFRLGIGRGKLDEKKSTAHNLHRRMVEAFVLSPFAESEAGAARIMIKHTKEALISALRKGLEQTMNRYN